MDQRRQQSSSSSSNNNSNRLSSTTGGGSSGNGNKSAVTVKQTSSQTTQTSPQVVTISHSADYQDPIQSIANVLNHHHHHLEQQKVLLSSAVARELAKSSALATPDNSSAAENSKRAAGKVQKSVKQQLVDQQGGRSLLLTVDNSGSAQNHQQQQQKKQSAGDTLSPRQASQVQSQREKELRAEADQQVAAVFKQQQQRLNVAHLLVPKSKDQIPSSSSDSPHSFASKSKLAAHNSTIQSNQQVEQGNSYLYAYNDFITSPASPPPDSHLSSVENHEQQQQVVINKKQQQREEKSNEQQVKTTTATTNKQQRAQQHNSKIARQDSQLSQVCLLTGETLSQAPPQAAAAAVVGRRGLEVTRVTASGDHQQRQRRSNRRHLLEGQDSELSELSRDDDDEEEDALSYILNRHNILVAQTKHQRQQLAGLDQVQHQNCNLLHLQQDSQRLTSAADVAAAAAACKQDNLNHLRQYLQIEENFNSYKAATARRRQPAEPSTSGQFIRANQLATSSAHDQLQQSAQEHQANKHQQQQFLSFQPPPPPTATSGANYLSSSSLSSSQSSLDQQQQHAVLNSQLFHTNSSLLEANGGGGGRSSYLQFFSRFAPANLLATGAGQKMYSANNQQMVGTLAGQPGAYYVTTNTSEPPTGGSSDSSHHDTRQQLPPHLHHLHHAHLTRGDHHLEGTPHHHHASSHQHHAHLHNHLHHNGAQPMHHNNHHHNHHATITTSSDSSLGSSGPFASSAVLGRTTSWLRDFCSKKCLFISCLMLILFIFILVISLSAYLNFLISSNRTNLQPLSGRMRVNAELLMLGEPLSASELTLNNITQQQQQQMLQRLVGNKTSSEFLQKQRDFETILRGALDRTQPTLKSYPNHLVKLEVYAFKPTSGGQQQQQPLWVYFRLFINKRTLQQDSQLMKRRAPDEQLEGQFLPRLTQQTLLNGFEQLITTFGGGGGQPQFGNRLVLATPPADTNSADDGQLASVAAQTLGVNSRRFGQQQTGDSPTSQLSGRRTSRAIAVASGSARPATAAQLKAQSQQQTSNNKSQQLKSFDEQISRLMHLIEAIDLQSIFVAPDFDLSASQTATTTAGGSGGNSQIMSDTLRASPSLVPTTTTTTTTQPTTTTFNFKPTTAAVTPATGSTSSDQDNNKLSTSGTSTTATSVKQTDDAENERQPPAGTTRKFTLAQSYRENSTRPAMIPAGSLATTTLRPTTITTAKESLFLQKHQQKPTKPPGAQGAIVRVQSGKPLENQAGQSTSEKQAAQARQAQEVAQKLKDGASLFGTSNRANSTGRPSATNNQQVPVPVRTTGTSSTPVTIEELWLGAFNKSQDNGGSESSSPSSNGRSRLITVTTIGGERQQQQPQPSDWQKVSVLSAEVSNTIRTQLTNAANQTELTTTLTPASSSSPSSSRPPKVSPHLNVGGNNGQPAKPARNQQQSSAVVLNRDFATSSTTTTTTTPASTNSTTAVASNARTSQPQLQPSHKKKQKNAQQRSSAPSSPANDAASAAAGTLRPTRNSTATNTSQQQQQKRQQQPKPAKVKKVSAQTPAQNDNLPPPADRTASRNQTTESVGASSELPSSGVADLSLEQPAAGTQAEKPTSVSKGIRIVDNFLASIGSAANSSTARSKPATQTPADQFVPTTTTIELTRSTTSLPPRTTSPLVPLVGGDQRPAQNTFVLASQQARPGTTSFSGQWRPLSSSGSSSPASANATDFWTTTANQQQQRPANVTGNRSSQQRKPNSGNLSLIVASERIPASLGQASGSQSPFAMPNAALVMQQQQPGQFSNRFRAPSPRTTTPSNDFESHRVSRMRQSASHSHRASDQASPFGFSSSSSGGGSSSTSTTTMSSLSTSSSSTTTSSTPMDQPPPLPPVTSSAAPPNTRIVDDFMITTERNDGPNGRATTLLPPLVLSGLHKSAVGLQGPPPISLVIAQGPKRTRGPFAFETLRSFGAIGSSSSEPAESSTVTTSTGSDATDPSPPSEPFDVSSSFDDTSGGEPASLGRSERSSSATSQINLDKQHQQQVLTDEKLLLRKQLFVDSGPPADGPTDSTEPDLSFAPSTNSPIATAAPPPTTPSDFADDFGDADMSDSSGTRFGKRRLTTATSSRNGRDLKEPTLSCPPESFGCRAKESGEFTCLSSSQVCDDFIDCQDDSDELDCVSLQRPEPYDSKMSPSNGAGIIYLNRRGTLAPMCIDQPLADDNLTSPPGNRSNERQEELIRQINTIGQYACSLQSFARLVSVKINHHNLVDGSNQIRDSKVFHRLAVSASQTGTDGDVEQNRISSSSTFKSPSQFQVEITTSSECPSQRTVFVKCGSFECGQDSLQLSSPNRRHLSSAAERAKALMRSAGDDDDDKQSPAEEDSPWLVKLYHNDALACHGYLIDESWLVAASECFMPIETSDEWDHRTSTGEQGAFARLVVDASKWTAEIQHETMGAQRRRVKAVHIQRVESAGKHEFSPTTIVLAKIERPVRFSLLNRPICLPKMNATHNSTRSETMFEISTSNYRNCITTGLVGRDELNLAAGPPTQRDGGLILNKVRLTRAEDCLAADELRVGGRDLICATETGDRKQQSSSDAQDERSTARVLICSQQPTATTTTTQTRSTKWVVVGVEHKSTRPMPSGQHRRRLFASVSSQIDWIVDTMNPKPATDNDTNQVNPNNGNHQRADVSPNQARRLQNLSSQGQLNAELNPPLQTPSLLFNNNNQQTCNRFKCSSGECLSWSRICDGLYDCSSHEDEMDCHK